MESHSNNFVSQAVHSCGERSERRKKKVARSRRRPIDKCTTCLFGLRIKVVHHILTVHFFFGNKMS
jgi:hypothetical protein